MTEAENTQIPGEIVFDTKDSQSRVITLNLCLVIGITASSYFGITDAVQRHFFEALVSLSFVIVFVLILFLNTYVPGVRKSLNIGFVAFIGVAFLSLLSTQFTGPAIASWCFIFPMSALFLLGAHYGTPALIIYNSAIICVFIVDSYVPHPKYDFNYAIRFCAPMCVISILAYYYEALRLRSIRSLEFLNLSLENRVEEKTKEFEKSQELLHQAEKMEAIGQLAGGIAHDFNNQLAGIVGYADMLREELSNSPELALYADNILLATRRASDLTSQLLAFARKGKYRAVSIDIHNIIHEVVNILMRTIDKRIIIKQHLDAQFPTTRGDPTQIQNAIMNVALNARDAMKNSGELIFSTLNVMLDEEYCRNNPYEIEPGEYVQLCITDDGIGMDEATKKRVFEPFFTTKEQGKGTGMGLASVYGTLKNHHGTINVYSEAGHGTTMKLYFPRHTSDALTKEQPMNKAEVLMGNVHILLVDDEDIVLDSTSRILEKIGYKVSVCRNGKEAIQLFRENWQGIDLVILDMVMPVLSGRETYLALKEINPDVLTLLSSGYSINGEARGILDDGVKGFIQKPFRIFELSQKVAELLQEKQGKE